MSGKRKGLHLGLKRVDAMEVLTVVSLVDVLVTVLAGSAGVGDLSAASALRLTFGRRIGDSL